MGNDCEILDTLRDYRDTFMMETDYRKQLVEHYYRTAPGIVKDINKHPNRDAIYRELMREYVLPAFHCLRQGDTEKALKIYERGVIFAMSTVGAQSLLAALEELGGYDVKKEVEEGEED